MLFTIPYSFFLPLFNGKSVAHICFKQLSDNPCLITLIITLSRIGNPVNHLSELLHCSPSHTIGQQRQDSYHVSRARKACCDRYYQRAFDLQCLFICQLLDF